MCMMGASMLGAGIGAIGALAQGQAQAQADQVQAQQDKLNAQLDQYQGVTDQIAGQQKQRQMVTQSNQLAGRQIAAYGAGGVTLDGSPTDVVLDSKQQAMLDVGAIKFNTDLQSNNEMFRAHVNQWNAGQEEQAAQMAQTSAIIGAAGALVGGLSKLGGGF